MIYIPRWGMVLFAMVYSAVACYLLRKSGAAKLWRTAFVLVILAFVISFLKPQICWDKYAMMAEGTTTISLPISILLMTLAVWGFPWWKLHIGIRFVLALVIGAAILSVPTWAVFRNFEIIK